MNLYKLKYKIRVLWHTIITMSVGRLEDVQQNFLVTFNGYKYESVLYDLDQQLRSWEKYGHNFTSAGEAIEKTREVLHKLMDDEGVKFLIDM